MCLVGLCFWVLSELYDDGYGVMKCYDYVGHEIHYFTIAQTYTIDYCPLKALDN